MSTLASKIAKASAIVGGALNPDKRNTQDRYEYVSADKILSVAGQAMAQVGVSVYPSVTSSGVDAFDRGSGKNRYDAFVNLCFILADDESEMTLTWVGYGSDYTVPDKAIYKAITSGHKYFLAKLLNIGAGNEDGEHETAGGASSESLAGSINTGPNKCQCGAPVGKLHASSCTATEPTPKPVPKPTKPHTNGTNGNGHKTETEPTINSLNDVELLDFNEGQSDASAEFAAIPSVPAGQPSSNGAKASKQAARVQSAKPVNGTNGKPADAGKMHAMITQMGGGLDIDAFRHFLVQQWSQGNRASTGTMDEAEVSEFCEWLDSVKRGRLDLKLPQLREMFQRQAEAVTA